MSHSFSTVIKAVIVSAVLVSSLAAFAQKAPAPGSYLVPQGWNVDTKDERALVSSPGGKAEMSLMAYQDKREPAQVCADFVAKQMEDKSKKIDVKSKKIFTQGGKDIAQMEVSIAQKGQAVQREWLVGVPVEGGTLLLVSHAATSDAKTYLPTLDKIVRSVLPKPTPKITPYKVSSPDVGLRLMAAAYWEMQPESKNKSTGLANMKLTKDAALLALSSKPDTGTAKGYLASFEKGAKARYKTFEKISEKSQKIAGVDGMRLDFRASAPNGATLRRSLLVFEYEGRRFVVDASAPDKEFDKYANDFNLMIGSLKTN